MWSINNLIVLAYAYGAFVFFGIVIAPALALMWRALCGVMSFGQK